jgi:putative restriction endonuclease
MKAVFDTRSDTAYDDDITRRYHFPRRYLGEARQAIGDWVVYREPRRGNGRQGYVAVARVLDITPASDNGHFYAHVVDFMPFDNVVPLRGPLGFYEGKLARVPNPALIGRELQGRSLRNIPDEEFAAIVRAGLNSTLAPENAVRLDLAPRHLDPETASLLSSDPAEQERRIAQILVNKKIRDAAFRRAVVDAYEGRCAVTGLRIINGGGKAEAEAAHIWSVADGGPDLVQNGIALSGTVHWLFDRHLISLTDDFGLLVSHNKVPYELRQLFSRQLERIHLPTDRRSWPNPLYVARHRERFAST